MLVNEAITRYITEHKACFRRKSWDSDYHIKIENGIMYRKRGKLAIFTQRWNPIAADLMAYDWEVI